MCLKLIANPLIQNFKQMLKFVGVKLFHADRQTNPKGLESLLRTSFPARLKIDCCRKSNSFYGSRIFITLLTEISPTLFPLRP